MHRFGEGCNSGGVGIARGAAHQLVDGASTFAKVSLAVDTLLAQLRGTLVRTLAWWGCRTRCKALCSGGMSCGCSCVVVIATGHPATSLACTRLSA